MAARLILSLDGQVIREYGLDKERITIGRKPHNDIQVDNLAVSGEHAAILTILNDSFMEDLGSTNGTLVNGVAVKRHFLRNGDVIEIGKHKLKYVNDVTTATTAEEFERTMVLRRGPSEPAPVVAAAARVASDTHIGAKSAAATTAAAALQSGVSSSQVATAAKSVGVIQVLNGPNAGRQMELTKNLVTMGKPGVQVAVITKRPTGYFITHVEGANFPTVNGASIGAQATALKDNDVIEIAGTKMEFFLKA